MPENNLSNDKKLEQLLAFSLGMMNGENGKMLIEKYQEAIHAITPYDMLRLEDKQMEMGITPFTIKQDIDKVINVFFKSLNNYEWDKPGDGFLYYLMLENEAFRFKLNQLKKIFKSYHAREAQDFEQMRQQILPLFRELTEFEIHYIKKENILFPYLEKIWDNHRPLKVMWSLHDDVRNYLKKVQAMLDDKQTKWPEFNKVLGKYYSLAFGMIQKENLVLFPIAAETVAPEAWQDMHLQSFEYAFAFIEAPQKPDVLTSKPKQDAPIDFRGIVSETGNMSVEQTLLVFNHLPVDISYVDENNKVVYFNNTTERIFPRSPAVIGRDVQNCHPPESVHMVNEIIEAFRKGKKSRADFWINMKGRFIFIQYFAIRDSNDTYKGVLEVSQDATELRQLKGERRLLEWQ